MSQSIILNCNCNSRYLVASLELVLFAKIEIITDITAVEVHVASHPWPKYSFKMGNQ